MTAPVEMCQRVARKNAVADMQSGAAQADRRCLFEGKAQGVGGDPEGPGPLGSGSMPVAPEIKLGASLVVHMCHIFSVGRCVKRREPLVGCLDRKREA